MLKGKVSKLVSGGGGKWVVGEGGGGVVGMHRNPDYARRK